MGVTLAKEHSAADWSARPLPHDWLTYAALDVELLVELRDRMYEILKASNKIDWALEEFASIVKAPPAPPRVDPWRRTSGMHVIRNQRDLAVIREVWHARDEVAREQDIAAGRILSDSHIVTLANSKLTKEAELKSLSFMHLRNVKRYSDIWISATLKAHSLPDDELPALKLPVTGPPAPRNWEVRNPQAWRRLEFARAQLSSIAEKLGLPVENLMTPETIRRVLWAPPDFPAELEKALSGHGARPWQIEIVSPILETAIWNLAKTETIEL
jgi:ribonuclease D